MAKAAKVYQLKVTLKYIEPPIWRRLLVPADLKLGRLHLALQRALGWTNSHLHEFIIGGETYGMPDPEGCEDKDVQDEKNVKLCDVADEKSQFSYVYDFGDDWMHQIVVEEVIAAEAKIRSPLCVDGARACPPEDCGGPPGYFELLDAIANPKHERHRELREWIGGEFDPEAFDLNDTNRAMQPARRSR